MLFVSSLSARIEIYDAATPKQLYSFTKRFGLTQTLADKIIENNKTPAQILVTQKEPNNLEAYILHADNRNTRLSVSAQNGISKIKLTPLGEKFIDRYAVVRLDAKAIQTNEADAKLSDTLSQSMIKYTGKKPLSISVLKRERVFGGVILPPKTVALLGEAEGFFMFAFEHNGELYDRNGAILSDTTAVTPVEFDRVSDFYSSSRLHPILKYFRAHQGVDLAAKYGTSVRSALDGRVIEVGYSPNVGNYVKIAHNNGFETIYGHLSKIKADLKPGYFVPKREIIGLVGSTGLATGPHLHFGVKKDGEYINPAILYGTPHSKKLEDVNFFAFAKEARRLFLESNINTKTTRNRY